MFTIRNRSSYLFLSILILLVSFPRAVNAMQFSFEGDINLQDTASCSALGGNWTDTICTLDYGKSMQINRSQTLTIPKGITLHNVNITILNRGHINNNGTIRNDGTLTNFGVITNAGAINNTGIIRNSGGDINNQKTIVNSGAIENQSEMENSGSIANSGILANVMARIENSGSIASSGSISNDYDISNSGSIANSGSIIGLGTITNKGDGTFTTTESPKDVMCNALATLITQANAESDKTLTKEQVQQLLNSTNEVTTQVGRKGEA